VWRLSRLRHAHSSPSGCDGSASFRRVPGGKRIEESFGWIKTVGGLRKTRHHGRALVDWFFTLTAAAYNLIRIPKLVAATG